MSSLDSANLNETIPKERSENNTTNTNASPRENHRSVNVNMINTKDSLYKRESDLNINNK